MAKFYQYGYFNLSDDDNSSWSRVKSKPLVPILVFFTIRWSTLGFQTPVETEAKRSQLHVFDFW